MKPILRASLLVSVLVTLLSACTDHLARPLSPQRLRLKSLNESGIVSPWFQTIFEYDAQNRQSGYTFIVNYPGAESTTHATITYDAQGQYQQNTIEVITGPSVGSATTLFTYRPDGQGGKLITASGGVQQLTYQVDAANRLVRSDFIEYLGAAPITYLYTYTGDNITRAEGVGQNRVVTYTYDDKPNPFYGLIRASEPIEWAPTRFSRNNIVSTQVNGGAGGGTDTGVRYNAQGSLNAIYNYTLTYEPY